MPLANLFKIEKEEKEDAVKKLVQKSYPGSNFYIMIVLASLIAAIGLIINNLTIIIGSMLVAPLLYPIIFFGMSIVLHDFNIIKRTALIIAKIFLLGILIGFFSALLFSPFLEKEKTGVFGDSAILPLFYVAISSGLAASFSITRKQMEEFLPGVAVSIALLPPLINIGVSLGSGHIYQSIFSLQVFLINTFGIIFASIIVFSLMGFDGQKKIADETIKEEKKCLKKGSAEFTEKK